MNVWLHDFVPRLRASYISITANRLVLPSGFEYSLCGSLSLLCCEQPSFSLGSHFLRVVMSTASASTPEGTSPANPSAPSAESTISPTDRTILEYLRSKGYKGAEKEFLAAVEKPASDDKGKNPEATAATSTTVSSEELVKSEAVQSQRPSRPGENALREPATALQELASLGNSTNVQNLISSIDAVGAEEILSLDPTDKQEGFRELEAWVDGSLDMYRVSMYVS